MDPEVDNNNIGKLEEHHHHEDQEQNEKSYDLPAENDNDAEAINGDGGLPQSASLENDALNQTAEPSTIANLQREREREEQEEERQQQENKNNKSSASPNSSSKIVVGKDMLTFGDGGAKMINIEHMPPEDQKKRQDQLLNFPGPDSNFPANIFDAPPSSVSLLKVKPLGLNYKEPTVRELMQPLPPDRVAFKGGMFNRFIHAAHRKKYHDNNNHSSSRRVDHGDNRSLSAVGGSMTPQTATQNHHNQSRQASASPGINTHHHQQQQKTTDSPSAVGGGNNGSSASLSQQASLEVSFNAGSNPMHNNTNNNNNNTNRSHTVTPRGQDISPSSNNTNNNQPDLTLSKSLNVLSKAFSSTTTSGQRKRGLSTHSESSPKVPSYLDARQHATPTKLLPYKGQLPDEAALVLADIRASVIQSAMEVNQVEIHGRAVVARRENANNSPVAVFNEVLDKTSPVTGKLAAHHQQMMSSMMEHSARSKGTINNNNNNSSNKNRDGFSTADFDLEQSMMETSFLQSMIMLDPELAPGVVAARAEKPPWAKAKQSEMSYEEFELLQLKNNRRKHGKGSQKKTTPRFATVTSSRKKQLPVMDQFKITTQQESERMEELEKRNAMFPSQLRPEDREEIEKREKAIKDQKRRHFLDEMVLARLAPAEREARLADREKLAPYRKVTDRDLPFPEQAARDRLKHAKAVVPPLVIEGMLATEKVTKYWRPRSPDTPMMNNNNNTNNNNSNTSPLLINSVGISSTHHHMSSTARTGGGGHLPMEGAPKMKQPLTGRDGHVQKAQERVSEKEKEMVAKFASMEAKMQVKQSRAQRKVFS